MMSGVLHGALQSDDGNPALLDTATGALSRVAFTLRLEEAAALAARLGHGISVVLVDLSEPSQLCAQHGPHAVDLVLAEMVDRLWGIARRSDTVARIGPARLAVLLPATDRPGAELHAARLQAWFGARPYVLPAGPARVRFEISVVGVLRDETPVGDALLAAIDGGIGSRE
jgi:diguanylate cyclase (GGDEF)-like protein